MERHHCWAAFITLSGSIWNSKEVIKHDWYSGVTNNCYVIDCYTSDWGEEIQLVWSIKTSVALFSLFIFRNHSSRWEWMMHTTKQKNWLIPYLGKVHYKKRGQAEKSHFLLLGFTEQKMPCRQHSPPWMAYQIWSPQQVLFNCCFQSEVLDQA